MTIKFKCPHCRAKIAFDNENRGKELECPECGETVAIPDTSVPEEKLMTTKKEKTESRKKPKKEKTTKHSKEEQAGEPKAEKEKEEEKEEQHDMDSIPKDHAETSTHEPVEEVEKEPWSVLDIFQAFPAAGNGSTLIVSTLLIFSILITATIPRYLSITIENSLMNYIFNGIMILIFLLGASISLGTLSKMHSVNLTGGKSMSIVDAIGYLFKHAHTFILSPLRVILLTAIIAGIEIGAFYLCKIPYLYGVLFLPLIIITLILVSMALMLYLVMILSAPAAAIDSFSGNGSYEQATSLIKKNTGRALGYMLINGFITLITAALITFILIVIFNVEQNLFAYNIIGGEALLQYYNAALTFVIHLPQENTLSKIKGVIFLISLYTTISVFFSYVLSLFGALHTISYLALKEDTGKV